jgi:hypothetical protein
MPGDILEKSLSVSNDATVAHGRRRSERVALRITLTLTARLAGGRRICVEVKSQVVNAHGGLLEVGMELAPGQRVMLNNNRGSELVTATILRVERYEEGRFFAAFEFEFPVNDFWPVTFPPDDLSWIG